MGRGSSGISGGGSGGKSGTGGAMTVPKDWKEYASEEIDSFMAGMSMEFPTPKGELTVSINGIGAGFATESLYDGSVINNNTGEVLYKGSNLTINKLRKALKKAVIG